MHIVSNIVGKLIKGKNSTDVLFSGFPAGTVTGAPKIRAIEIIEELEKNRRNVYAGSVGYISANGNIDTCIALRTALIKEKIFMFKQVPVSLLIVTLKTNIKKLRIKHWHY